MSIRRAGPECGNPPVWSEKRRPAQQVDSQIGKQEPMGGDPRAGCRAFAPKKDVIAAAIAGRFPELRPRLPKARACGDSEDYEMSVFDAAAFAIGYF